MTQPAHTMEEAAALIPASRRWLQKFLADNPADAGGTPFYFEVGNRKMFTDAGTARQNTARTGFPNVEISLKFVPSPFTGGIHV